MVSALIGFGLLFCLLLAISLKKTYRSVSTIELKRRARQGDNFANILYRGVGFGLSLDLLLWGVIALVSALLFLFLSNELPPIAATIIIFIIILFSFAWLPATPSTRFGRTVARYATPPLTQILNVIYPLTNKLERFIRRHHPVSVHTGMYEKDDLINLIDRQKVQIDNRVTARELRIAKHALTFGAKRVSDAMTPRRAIKSVNANDPVGPHLMDELHKSGHSRFPVYDGNEDNIVGILYLRDLIDVRGGQSVKNVMQKKVYYVNENAKLNSVLQASIKTHRHIFVVVNDFEEITGVITLEDVMEEILGKQIVDEFDKYDDLRAVAAQNAKKQTKERETLSDQTSSNKT